MYSLVSCVSVGVISALYTILVVRHFPSREHLLSARQLQVFFIDGRHFVIQYAAVAV